MNLKKHIRKLSKKAGIDIVGFTDSSPLDIEDIILEKRKSGKYTEFEEKDIEKRINPKLTMEKCKSIIVVGVSYNTAFKAENLYNLNGKISMSSWGSDYHRVLKIKIKSLIDALKEEMDFEYKAFVDTGPLVDRELARRAGVGFFGKNCSIINKEYGSFIFLGYILTDISIDPDSPTKEDCGDCDICLRSCPTSALENPYDLNPKKCISYLTQTKEIISEDLRKKMSTKIYGCDTCQNVCPKNKDVKLSTHNDFIPFDTGGVMDLEKLLFMSNREFKREFGSMAGSWRGKSILKRNAVIAIGNMKDTKNIPLLLEVKRDSNEILKGYIDWAIGNILGS